MADVFFSYSQSDRKKIEPIVKALRSAGLDVWYDTGVMPGETWDRVIGEKLDAAKCIIVAWSSASVSKDWVREEATEGKNREILVPIKIEDVVIPAGFRFVQAANLVGWSGDKDELEWRQFVEQVRYLVEGTDPAVQPYKPPINWSKFSRRTAKFIAFWAFVAGLASAFVRLAPTPIVSMVRPELPIVEVVDLPGFERALRVYSDHPEGIIDQAKILEAKDLWTKYAMSGDVRSANTLGDLYSNKPFYISKISGPTSSAPLPSDTGVISEDRVAAYAWYLLAASLVFNDYGYDPDETDLAAQERSRTRLQELGAVMTVAQIYRAYDYFVNILATEGPIKLYRLGTLYQAGVYLPKDNVQALKYYNLAANRAKASNPDAVKSASFLKTIMTREEILEAEKMAREWEPPLPLGYAAKPGCQCDAQQTEN